jgi:transposase
MAKKRLELPYLTALWGAGYSTREIAGRLGCAEGTVRGRLKEAGLFYKRSSDHPHAADMVRLYKEGWSVLQIAAHLNVATDTVYRYLARAGLYVTGKKFIRARQKRAVVTALYKEGYTLDQITELSGIPRTTVYRHLNQSGDWFVFNPKLETRRAYERIIHLENKGYRQIEIAAQLGYTRHSIRRIKKRYGHPPLRTPITDFEKQEFRRLWGLGHSLSAIARQTRRDKKAIRDYLIQQGVYERRKSTWKPPAHHPWRFSKR